MVPEIIPTYILQNHQPNTISLNPVLKPPHNSQIFHTHQRSPLKNKPSLICARMIYPSSTSQHMWDYAFPFILLACPSWPDLIIFFQPTSLRHATPWNPEPFSLNPTTETLQFETGCASRATRASRASRASRESLALLVRLDANEYSFD